MSQEFLARIADQLKNQPTLALTATEADIQPLLPGTIRYMLSPIQVGSLGHILAEDIDGHIDLRTRHARFVADFSLRLSKGPFSLTTTSRGIIGNHTPSQALHIPELHTHFPRIGFFQRKLLAPLDVPAITRSAQANFPAAFPAALNDLLRSHGIQCTITRAYIKNNTLHATLTRTKLLDSILQ